MITYGVDVEIHALRRQGRSEVDFSERRSRVTRAITWLLPPRGGAIRNG